MYCIIFKNIVLADAELIVTNNVLVEIRQHLSNRTTSVESTDTCECNSFQHCRNSSRV